MRKHLIVLCILSVMLCVTRGNAYAFAKGTEQDCSKCHTLNNEQARDALKPLAPDLKILSIQPAPVSGFWELGVESAGRKNILYLDFSKKKIIIGNLIDIQTKANLTRDSLEKISKIDVSLIPLEHSLVMGNKDAKYKIIVFDDPE